MSKKKKPRNTKRLVKAGHLCEVIIDGYDLSRTEDPVYSCNGQTAYILAGTCTYILHIRGSGDITVSKEVFKAFAERFERQGNKGPVTAYWLFEELNDKSMSV